ncbi:MAG: hypothetical protein AB3N18_07140 [Allomuricauda sp.]
MKNLRLFILNIALLIISVGYVIPNVISEKPDLTQEYGTLRRAYIETYKYKPRRSFTYKEGKRLVLVTSDRIEKTYKLSSHYRIYWKKFLDKNALGKELRVYLRTNDKRTDPLIVELDKKKVYGKSSIMAFYIIILTLTVGITAYNLYQVFGKKNVEFQ